MAENPQMLDAKAVLSAFPFLAVSSSVLGGDIRRYHRIYERTPPKGLVQHYGYHTAGVFAFALYISLQASLFDEVRPVGGRGLVFLLTFVTSTLFWWWSSYMLLYRQVPLRQMLPAGVATGACAPGLGIVSAFFFSDQVASGQKGFGPAGVVIAL